MNILTILALSVLLIINWHLYKHFLSPAIVTNLVWLVIILIYNTTDHILYPLSDQFYLIVLIWTFGFSFAAILPSKLKLSIPEVSSHIEKEKVFKFFLPVMIVCLIISIWGRIQIGRAYNSSNIFAGIYAHSVSSLNGDQSIIHLPVYFGLAQEVCNFAIAVIGSLIFFRHKKSKPLIIATVLLITFTLFRSNKFSVCQLLFFFLTMKILTSGISKKTILIFIGAFIILILAAHIMRRNENSSGEINIINMLSVYLLAPLPAFDYVINAPINLIEDFNGEYTFRAFIPYLNMLGFDLVGNSDPFNLHFWCYTPLHINVYTVFFNFYVDFGIAGILFASLAYGSFFGFLWKGCVKKIPLFIVSYSAMSYILFFQFFADFLISYFWANALPLIFFIMYFTHFSLKFNNNCRVS